MGDCIYEIEGGGCWGVELGRLWKSGGFRGVGWGYRVVGEEVKGMRG